MQPIPDPSPMPAKPAWVILVEQTEERSPETAKIMAASKFWEGLVARGIKWRTYDYDAPEAASYRKIADGTGMPSMIFTDEAGKVLKQGRLPDTLIELKGLLP